VKLENALSSDASSRRRRDSNEKHRETMQGVHRRLLRKSPMGKLTIASRIRIGA
jgi:hypothetical protein